MLLEPYDELARGWPASGRHILATFDEASVVVYQAYRPAIGRFAAGNQRFGGGFSVSRMSWVKPNFLWIMYRSGWGTKEHQETTLAVRIRRDAFDAILAAAVPSSYVPELYATRADWQAAVARSEVRLQWDPDHDPGGAPLARRAIQLGLRGSVLARYAREWVVAIDDISDFVAEARALRGGALKVPAERVYPVADREVARRLGLSLA
jgi:hypothetical protein